MTPVLTREELLTVRAHVERAYPREGCGFVLREPSEVLDCRNVQGWRRWLLGPFARPATEAFVIHPRDVLAMERRRRQGATLHAIYHSHPDARADFSTADVRGALRLGQPVHPGVAHVVVAVRHGRADVVKAFRWSPSVRKFVLAGALSFREAGWVQPRALPMVEAQA